MTELPDVSFEEFDNANVMSGAKMCGGLCTAGTVALTDKEAAEFKAVMDTKNALIDSCDAVTESFDASYDYANDYFYKQLSSDYKALYKEILIDLETILTGTDTYDVGTLKVNWQDTEGNVTSADEPYILAYYASYDVGYPMAKMLIYSNPQYFFIDEVIAGTYGGEEAIFLLTHNNFQKGSVRAAAKSKIDSVTNNWMKAINACPDELAKECKIAELICYYSKYHLDSEGNMIGKDTNQTIYVCLVDQICVCAGFAKTFLYFCRKVGIDCIGMIGTGHAFNRVKINGRWYETCLTGMNQCYTDYYDGDYTYYAFLNRGSLYKLKNNDPAFLSLDFITDAFTLPTCSYDMPVSFYTRVDVSTPGQATVAWKNIFGASQYAIYTVYNGEYTYAGKVTAPSSPYTNYSSYTIKNMTGGRTYGFLVRALFSDPVKGSVWTGFTNACIVKGKVEAAEAKPVITKIMPGNGQMGLNWSSVSGAKQYAAYYYLNGKWILAGKTTGTGMYVRGLANGTKYGFAVKAYVNGTWTSITSADVVYATPAADKANIIDDISDIEFIDAAPVIRA